MKKNKFKWFVIGAILVVGGLFSLISRLFYQSALKKNQLLLDREYLVMHRGLVDGSLLATAFVFENEGRPSLLAKCFRGKGTNCTRLSVSEKSLIENKNGELNGNHFFGRFGGCAPQKKCDYSRATKYRLFCNESSCDRLTLEFEVRSLNFPSLIRKAEIEADPNIVAQMYFKTKYSKSGFESRLTRKYKNPR